MDIVTFAGIGLIAAAPVLNSHPELGFGLVADSVMRDLDALTGTLIHATNLRRLGAGGGVAHEDITVHEVPLAQVHSWLEAKAKSGVLVDPKVYAGLYFIGRNE